MSLYCKSNKPRKQRKEELLILPYAAVIYTKDSCATFSILAELNYLTKLSSQQFPWQQVYTLNKHSLTSMIGLDASTFSSTLVSFAEPPTVAKKRIAYFAETVFPAPDSPLTIMD